MSESVQKQPETKLAEHLIGLPGGQWALWRWVGLRGAGFPAAEVLKLSAPATARAADRLIEAEEAAECAKTAGLGEINAALDALKRNNEWGDIHKRRPLLKALSLIKAGKLPEDLETGVVGQAMSAVHVARARVEVLKQEFDQHFEASGREITQAICAIAASDHFREAVVWQNRQALHTGIDRLLKKSPEDGVRGSKQRQHEEMVASYLQRYCVKNDTIGFFGPVGWARFVSAGEALTARPGERLVTARKTYFETWGIQTLAKTIASQPASKPWLKPIRMPFLRVQGTTLHHPLYGSVQIPPAQAAILTVCDGEHFAKEIALMLKRSSYVADENQAYGLLDQLARQGLVFVGFNIPIDPFPEQILRQLLDQIGEDHLRQRALAALDELENARCAVAASAGDAEKLDRALDALEETFTRLTGLPPTRSAGKTYAARTLVYEDCRRDIEVEMGPDLLNSLAEPLSLLLTSGRWFTYEFANIYREKFQQIYDALVRKTNSPTIDGLQFWFQAMPFLIGNQSNIAHSLLAEYKTRWERVLSGDWEHRHVRHSAEQLRSRVLGEFAAPKAGWEGARYHSPDIMILARSAEDVRRGDYQFVMGEIHFGINTLGTSLFFHQHPCPESLLRAVELDLPGSIAVPMTLGDCNRTMDRLVSPSNFRLELTGDALASPRSKALPIASLVVEKNGNELVARTRDGRVRFDLIRVISIGFGGLVSNCFRVFTTRPYTPRMSIDRLVISRETWRVAASDLTFAYEKDEAQRCLAARRWARAYDMPRFVFIKTPVEMKPCFVDFDSPIYIDLFLKLIRRTREQGPDDSLIDVTEMLPTPDQLWLQDRQGRRYTSEFRLVALDLAG
jgi:hypothetical protein